MKVAAAMQAAFDEQRRRDLMPRPSRPCPICSGPCVAGRKAKR